MATNKKSFILYADIKTTIDKLDNEYAGKLFKHILALNLAGRSFLQ